MHQSDWISYQMFSKAFSLTKDHQEIFGCVLSESRERPLSVILKSHLGKKAETAQMEIILKFL